MDAVFEAARAFTADATETSSFMLSLELREIDVEFSRKVSPIRDHLPSDMH